MSVMKVFVLVMAFSLALFVALNSLPWLTANLIRFAARRLPQDTRDRYFEQWSAEAEQLPDGLGKFLWAFDLIRASLTIDYDRKSTSGDHPSMVGGIALMVPLLLVALAEASRHPSEIFPTLLLVGGGFLLLGWYDDRDPALAARPDDNVRYIDRAWTVESRTLSDVDLILRTHPDVTSPKGGHDRLHLR
jgi:hypothetical protein